MTAKEDPEFAKNTLETANRSGFPFQMAVKRMIEDSEKDHHWEIVGAEQAWGDPTGRGGFIDIVARNGTVDLIIECKRRAEGRWVFLRESSSWIRRDVLIVGSDVNQRHLGKGIYELAASIEPATVECEFCAVPGASEKDRGRSLEGLASDVVLAAEAWAVRTVSDPDLGARFPRRAYIPMIVTNLEIAECAFDPAKVPLSDGLIPPDEAVPDVVPAVRFTKSVGGSFPPGFVTKDRRRTVLVVSAPQLQAFLCQMMWLRPTLLEVPQ
ncbi:MAG TPA: hypothetical protein VKM54_27635 [Myxococcota bacterium]|nr:hypothetical protein [Myxococcota bacterium]